MTAVQNRYDFVYYFDVTDGNPNGDPDAENAPRIDLETNQGLVTDVCLKRKIRDYVDATRGETDGYAIYVRDGAVLNQQHERGYEAAGIDAPTSRKQAPDAETRKDIAHHMCRIFFDVRTFGAVMDTEVPAGRVRGPVQLTFARSVDPILPHDISITRCAVTNARDAQKERTMGRKPIVPYALYRAEGAISAGDASRTGFTEDDRQLLLNALTYMFDQDRAAARGRMAPRGLFVFKHESPYGNAPAHALVERVTARRATEGPPRTFNDYTLEVADQDLPSGVTLERAL